MRDRLGPSALLSLANAATLRETREPTTYSDDESDQESESKIDPKT